MAFNVCDFLVLAKITGACGAQTFLNPKIISFIIANPCTNHCSWINMTCFKYQSSSTGYAIVIADVQLSLVL